jgi:hypothetical protein
MTPPPITIAFFFIAAWSATVLRHDTETEWVTLVHHEAQIAVD